MDMTKILIEVVIFTALIGVIATAVADAISNGSLTGASLIIVGLITLFVSIGFVTYLSKTMGFSRK